MLNLSGLWRRPRHALCTVFCISLLTALGCQAERPYPSRPVLLVCPWSQGGGTDRVSRAMAAHLEQELDVPVNVVNATGGKGVTGHNRGLTARPDGYTLTMTTLELNMMHWSGLTELTVDDCMPLMSLNEDYAAILVRDDAPWQTLGELRAAIKAAPHTLKASGTTTGGAWHLALAGWLIAEGWDAEDVTWISSTGAAPSLQELMSGGLDLVCCSLPEASSNIDGGQVRALGVMAPQRVAGFEDVPTFAEQGVDWSLGGWRALALPAGTPPKIYDRLLKVVERIVSGQTQVAGTTFPEFMEKAGFDHTNRSGEELNKFLHETDRKFGELLTSDAMKSVNRDPFPPMAFPGLILGLMSLTVLIGAVMARRGDAPRVHATPPDSETRNYLNFALVIGAVLVYCLLAETVGFLLLAAILVLGLSWRMGLRWPQAIVLALVFPAVIYVVFAQVLRVPLPQGWLSW